MIDRQTIFMMKKYSISIALIVFALVLSCSNDSDDTPEEVVEPTPVVDRSGNLLGTGASANDILSNTNFTKLEIEIAYVVGHRPTNATMVDFQEYIQQHTFKDEIELIFNELPSPDEEDLTLREIADLEQENRTVYNNNETLGVYIYFSDAPSDEDDEDEGLVTLGAVYRNTSMVIYESTVRRLSNLSNLISVTDVEIATLNHEFGHLFGLVNIGTLPVNDHEDVLFDEDGNPQLDNDGNEIGNNHCNVPGCLMRAELQFGNPTTLQNGLKSACQLSGVSMMKMLESSSLTGKGIVPDLDSECILDLQGNGGR